MTDDRLTAALTRHLDAGGDLPELGAPYDDLLAGLVSGSLLDDERESALHLLDEHPGYRALLATVADATPAEQRAPAGRLLSWPRLAAAAAVLLAVGAAAFLVGRGAAPGTPDEQLVAAVDALRARDADLFGSFEPLAAKERSQRWTDVVRGGLELIEPRQAVLTAKPVFRWRNPDGTTAVELKVVNEDGEVVLSRTAEGASLSWPQGELAPGRYVWQVVATSQGARATSSLAFTRLDEAAKERYERGLTAIRATQDKHTAVLAAHWAIRMELWGEARRLLEGAGDSPLVAETRAWVEAQYP